MSNASLTVKPVAGDGGTSYVDGNYLPAAELEADFNAIINVVNGNLDETNLHSSTQIPNTMLAEIQGDIVADYATDAAEYAIATSPGDTATPSLPTDLEEEWARMRYRVGRNKGYASTSATDCFYMNASAVATPARWYEPAIVGRNLLPNPGFEVHSAGTPNAPNGWTLESTPSVVAIENPAHTGLGLEKRSLNIVTDGSNEGIKVVIGGLKASTKYLVGMNYSLTAGTINITTTNGLASGAYQNLALSDASAAAASVETLQGIVKTTAVPASLTVSIFGSASGADFNLHNVWMYELTEGAPVELPHIAMQTARDITASTFPTTWTGSGNTWRTDTLTSLSLTQYVPYPGYRMTYEVSVPYNTVDSAAGRESSRVYLAIQQNIDGGGATTVAGPVIMEIRADAADMRDSGSFFLRHVVENPTPGSSYAFTTLLGVYDAADFEQVSVPPIVSSVQMAADARLIVERI